MHPMPGNANKASQASLARSDNGFQRTTRPGYLIQLFHAGHSMDLVQVKVIDSQALQRTL